MTATEIELDEVVGIQDSIINMPEILAHMNPNHVHWSKHDQPWFFRWIPEIISECGMIPGAPTIIGFFYGLYFKLRGLEVTNRYTYSVTVFVVKPDLSPRQRGSLAFFREIDFRIGNANFASTRIDGDRNMYHLFYGDSETYMARALNNISDEEQGNFVRFQQANMLGT